MEKALTAAEAAEVLGVTLRTVRQYLASGQLQGRKCGKQWRIHQDTIRQFLMSGVNTPIESHRSTI